jgi:hypothetical protein
MQRLFLLLLVALFAGCSGAPNNTCRLSTLNAYPSDGFETNTEAERRLLSQLAQFGSVSRESEVDAGVRSERARFDGLLNEGSPSVRALTAPGFLPVLDEALDGFVAAQGRLFVPAEPPVAPGGIYGAGASSWIFSERGVDLRQVIDKGLYSALLFNEAVKRIPQATTAASVDQLLALYGAAPTFPQADSGPVKDEWAAKYAKRRNPPGMTGVYTRLRDAFIQAKAAAASPQCAAERETALVTIANEWEQALASTAIFYVYSAGKKLQDPAATVATKASALHDVGEGAGFLMGLLAVDSSQRRITDAQLQSALTSMRVPSVSTATVHRLLTDVPADVDGLLKAASTLQAAYGFTAGDISVFQTAY